MWPFKKRTPDMEQRAAFPSVTAEYLSARRDAVRSEGSAALSATIGTAAFYWSRAFAMLDPTPDDGPLRADVLAAIGLDLCLRGESVWHIRVEGNELTLHRVAYWDELGRGRYHLHIARPAETESVRAIEGEVLRLTINSDAGQPWRGRSPFLLMGGSPRLMAEIEGAISSATEWLGKGVLPFPDTVPEEQQAAALRGLKGGGTLAAIKSRADFAMNTGQSRGNEFRRVELGPDLRQADLNPAVDSLHARVLAAAGIPPALTTANGNAGAMREAYRLFVLQTVEPMARQLLPEFAKVGVFKMSNASMMSADVAGRARAVGVLTGAGVPLDRAMRLVGWGEER
ncbi:hypothetical protein [Sagittula sp. MA-2]|jgi:hypothetical protein|uniref:hypothetical protein n=1 Tax=Sagittula sp. MA-2 TaxID=3048007 RepID=UPI0024C2272D|nr:hypothetical protein [Sagittula sp. MA-2]WHZ37503.1 hypothetical protein QNI11_10885 [Sagittula sp. MA-2]